MLQLFFSGQIIPPLVHLYNLKEVQTQLRRLDKD